MRIGIAEILLIILLAIVLLKPEKLKDYMKTFKGAMSKVADARKEINEELEAEKANISEDMTAEEKQKSIEANIVEVEKTTDER